MSKLLIGVLALSFWLSNLPSPCASILSQLEPGSAEQSSKAVLHIGEIISRVADPFNYRSVRAYKVAPDEWDTADRQPLLVAHAYYSLFSRDPDSLLDLGPMHRGVSRKHIRALILLFKDVDSAGKEVLLLRKSIEGDLGAKVVKADENGFEVRAAYRSQIAVRHGAIVILLETDKQGETMAAMAAKLGQASW